MAGNLTLTCWSVACCTLLYWTLRLFVPIPERHEGTKRMIQCRCTLVLLPMSFPIWRHVSIWSGCTFPIIRPLLRWTFPSRPKFTCAIIRKECTPLLARSLSALRQMREADPSDAIICHSDVLTRARTHEALWGVYRTKPKEECLGSYYVKDSVFSYTASNSFQFHLPIIDMTSHLNELYQQNVHFDVSRTYLKSDTAHYLWQALLTDLRSRRYKL